MIIVIIFALSLASIALGFWLGRMSQERKKAEGSLEKINAESQARKEEGKARILELFRDKANFSNDDIQALLGVSDATAANYLTELEKEGKIAQEGDFGRFVRYKLKG